MGNPCLGCRLFPQLTPDRARSTACADFLGGGVRLCWGVAGSGAGEGAGFVLGEVEAVFDVGDDVGEGAAGVRSARPPSWLTFCA